MRSFILFIFCSLIAMNVFAQTRTFTKKEGFVEGQIPIFIDSLHSEQAGEFPSRWDLVTSGLVEIMEMAGKPVIGFVERSSIAPLMVSKNYLPAHFTIEFDAYFHNIGNEAYTIYFDNKVMRTRFSLAGITHNSNLIRTDKPPKAGWKHLRLSFNKRSLQAFIDDERLANVPNIEVPPANFYLKVLSHGSSKNKFAAIRNIRVMEGGLPIYDRLITDGSFTTRQIQFEVGKARLRKASTPILREVALVLMDHPEMTLTIEGHTDDDGSPESNIALGQRRAAAVMAALEAAGISTNRLEAVSYGEAIPIASNETPEGKYLNRRVVFSIKE